MSAAMQSNRLSVMRMVGRIWLTITGWCQTAVRQPERGVVSGELIAPNLAEIDWQNALSKLVRRPGAWMYRKMATDVFCAAGDGLQEQDFRAGRSGTGGRWRTR
ncbi:hypothetical protein [Klebsiella pneumoniae]|uniref:hypothetical protein n=1 Tax=Klebsiella pneumoniae TaxID=573 RepID=UPI0022B698CB|nr:hypothetical protein [Klebsiella pneumoniae]